MCAFADEVIEAQCGSLLKCTELIRYRAGIHTLILWLKIPVLFQFQCSEYPSYSFLLCDLESASAKPISLDV